MLRESKIVSAGDEAQYVFKGVIFYFDHFATVFAHDVVMVGLKRFGELCEGRPAMDGCLSDAEFGKELECAVDARTVYSGRAPGYFSVFERFFGGKECLKDRFARCGDAQVVCLE